MTLQEKVENIVTRYDATFEKYNEDLGSLLEEAVLKTEEIKQDALIRQTDDQVKEMHEHFQNQATNQNNLLKVLIEEERDKIIPTFQRSDDYATKVSNAIAFLNMELEDADLGSPQDFEELDVVLHGILKDFIYDYDQMKLFKRMIEKKTDFVNISGKSNFPKTFGAYNQIQSLHSTFDTLESFAERAFLDINADGGQRVNIYGHSYAYPIESYKGMVAKKQVVELAGQIDEVVEELDVA